MGDIIFEFLEGTIGAELAIIVCSMIPIVELRGAIPLGALVCHFPWWKTFILAVIGNMIPLPFIVLFMDALLKRLNTSKVKIFNKFANFLNRKIDKNQPKIEKYGFWGLTLFIGIPLPMTGGWTGSLVASFMKMKFWKAMLSAFIGVLMAAVIMTLLCYVFIPIIPGLQSCV